MKIKTKYAKVKYHRYIENGENITREDGTFDVYSSRLTEAGCKNKTPGGCFFDGFEIVNEVYEVDESVIRQYGTLIVNEPEQAGE